MSDDNPRDVWDLSQHRYHLALDRVETACRADDESRDYLLNEMRIVRMVSLHRAPWWGEAVDPDDSSVTVGVMMRNAFEAVGDDIDYDPTGEKLTVTSARHWLTRRYLPLWRRGKKEYSEWLDTLGLARPPERAPGVDNPAD